jgi:hypothetical protein
VNGAATVTGALTAGSVASGGVTLAQVASQITQVADFTGSQVTLKAVDATNATVSTQAGTTTVGAVAGSTSATSAFLDFFRRLFGGG